MLFALGNEVRKARELGSYRLLERLGEGGMGEVCRARHRLLARPAAIKLIRPLAAPSIVGSEAASRFEREAQASRACARRAHREPVRLWHRGRRDVLPDIYGTGCFTYWLLTGQLVFTGDTPMQFLVQHAQATPEPPSARTELPVPKELDAIVLACLAKDPADRRQTARELARRLEAVPDSDAWTPELARAWWDTHEPLRA